MAIACWMQDSMSTYFYFSTATRGSHIDLACRSICDQDQNGIKRSTLFLGADQGIKMNSEQLADTLQAWLRFILWTPIESSDQEPWNRAIKRSRALEQSKQAIKDDFHWSRFLISVANVSTGKKYVTTPCTSVSRRG